MNLSLIFASWFQPEWHRCVQSWNHPFYLVPKLEIMEAYQRAFTDIQSDILGYLHDDLVCHDVHWRERVMREFEDDSVAVVGFAGGWGQGHPSMYNIPFQVNSMGRVGFRSNMLDWERHGAHFEGECNVTILDGMAIFVRRSFLEEIGGWPQGTPVGYFCYDFWICAMALRHNRRIRLVGVKIDHLGGRSTGLNPDLKVNLEEAHRYIYDNFHDVLPSKVTP